VLVVGDPSSSEPRLPRLPATHVEALAAPRHRSSTWRRGHQGGSRRQLVSDIAPTASGVVLDGGEHLSVTDLAGLDLDADLLALSACDTGRGDVTLGGDVVGLTRQLLATSVRLTLVSLWPVEDRAAFVLIGRP
jgi:hypothetical protein